MSLAGQKTLWFSWLAERVELVKELQDAGVKVRNPIVPFRTVVDLSHPRLISPPRLNLNFTHSLLRESETKSPLPYELTLRAKMGVPESKDCANQEVGIGAMDKERNLEAS